MIKCIITETIEYPGQQIIYSQINRPENILLTVVCIVLAVLLLKKRKRKEPEVLRTSETSTPLVSVKTELTQPDVPEDTLRDMRKYYSTMQAENDARIMRALFCPCPATGQHLSLQSFLLTSFFCFFYFFDHSSSSFRNWEVYPFPDAATSSGVPQTSSCPPPFPPSGPISIT